MMIWSKEQTNLLTKHFKAGLSTRESAEALTQRFGVSFTKNGVIGRRHRLGLVHGVYFKDIAKANAARAEARRQAQDDKKQKRAELKAHKAKKQAEVERTVAARAEKAKQRAEQKEQIIVPVLVCDMIDTKEAIMALQPHHCRYPYGQAGRSGFRFCCQPKQGGSRYCAEHRAACTVTIEPRSGMRAARV
jgi:hypothetical protein